MSKRSAAAALEFMVAMETLARRRALVDKSRAMRADGRWPKPRPVEATGECWAPPPLTPQQKQEFDEYSKKFNLPF